jgi:hypothetical protein
VEKIPCWGWGTSKSAEIPSAWLRAGSSLRCAIPRGFVQDDNGIGIATVFHLLVTY